MQLVIDRRGAVRCLYAETLDLSTLGLPSIARASHVETDSEGRWWAEVIGGPTLGPFDRRSEALAAEADWLNRQLRQPPTSTSIA